MGELVLLPARYYGKAFMAGVTTLRNEQLLSAVYNRRNTACVQCRTKDILVYVRK